jgi:hypothetical protein
MYMYTPEFEFWGFEKPKGEHLNYRWKKQAQFIEKVANFVLTPWMFAFWKNQTQVEKEKPTNWRCRGKKLKRKWKIGKKISNKNILFEKSNLKTKKTKKQCIFRCKKETEIKTNIYYTH